MKDAVLLLSGGLDSTTLLHHLRQAMGVETVWACSFHYGQKHARELDMAAWQARAAGVREHRVIDLAFLGGFLAGASALLDPGIAVPELSALTPEQRRQPSTYVPNRNMILLSLAAAYAESRGVRDVFYGAQAQDEYGYWDCTVDFLRGINDILRLNRGGAVTVHAPFMGLSKAEVLRTGLALEVDFGHTWSCYCGQVRPCGTCPTCVERAAAFRVCGVGDPLARA